MNRDHAEAVLTYAQRYGNQQTATSATLTSIDSQGMDLQAEVDGGNNASASGLWTTSYKMLLTLIIRW